MDHPIPPPLQHPTTTPMDHPIPPPLQHATTTPMDHPIPPPLQHPTQPRQHATTPMAQPAPPPRAPLQHPEPVLEPPAATPFQPPRGRRIRAWIHPPLILPKHGVGLCAEPTLDVGPRPNRRDEPPPATPVTTSVDPATMNELMETIREARSAVAQQRKAVNQQRNTIRRLQAELDEERGRPESQRCICDHLRSRLQHADYALITEREQMAALAQKLEMTALDLAKERTKTTAQVTRPEAPPTLLFQHLERTRCELIEERNKGALRDDKIVKLTEQLEASREHLETRRELFIKENAGIMEKLHEARLEALARDNVVIHREKAVEDKMRVQREKNAKLKASLTEVTREWEKKCMEMLDMTRRRDAAQARVRELEEKRPDQAAPPPPPGNVFTAINRVADADPQSRQRRKAWEEFNRITHAPARYHDHAFAPNWAGHGHHQPFVTNWGGQAPPGAPVGYNFIAGPPTPMVFGQPAPPHMAGPVKDPFQLFGPLNRPGTSGQGPGNFSQATFTPLGPPAPPGSGQGSSSSNPVVVDAVESGGGDGDGDSASDGDSDSDSDGDGDVAMAVDCPTSFADHQRMFQTDTEVPWWIPDNSSSQTPRSPPAKKARCK